MRTVLKNLVRLAAIALFVMAQPGFASAQIAFPLVGTYSPTGGDFQCSTAYLNPSWQSQLCQDIVLVNGTCPSVASIGTDLSLTFKPSVNIGAISPIVYPAPSGGPTDFIDWATIVTFNVPSNWCDFCAGIDPTNPGNNTCSGVVAPTITGGTEDDSEPELNPIGEEEPEVNPIGEDTSTNGVTSFEPTLLENPLGGTGTVNSLPDLVVKILNIVLAIGVPIVALAIIYAGFLFVWAQGNPGDVEKAKTTLMWTLIGATLLLGAFVIARAIKGTIEEISKEITHQPAHQRDINHA